MRNLDKLGIFMTLLKSKLKFSKLSKTKFVFPTAITLTILETANPPASRASIG